MTAAKTYQGSWRSDKAEQRYRTNDLKRWAEATADQPTARDVETRFGPTRVYHWPGSGPAVIFLHGMGDTSIRWIPYAEALSNYDVYAIDIMGDVGQSVQEVGFSSAEDYSVWLGDAVDGLGLVMPHIVGHSLGGYLALGYAMGNDRVASVVAYDPVGVVDLKMVRFLTWGVAVGIAAYCPGPIRRFLAKRLRMPILNDKPAARHLTNGQTNHPPAMPPLPVFTSEQLRSIVAPTWVVAGEKSNVFDVDRLVERINQEVPKGNAQLLPGAGHALANSHVDQCLAILNDVLGYSPPVPGRTMPDS